jgi:chromate reductase
MSAPLAAKTRRILMVSGSLRAGSTNTALLRTALRIAPAGLEAVLYEGLGDLPHFNPDADPVGGPVDPAVAQLRAQIKSAGALLFSTPEYAGALPGSFKNLLDWTVGGGETYGMPVAWVNTAGPASPNGAGGAHDSLRAVLGYTGSEIVEAACTRIPVPRGTIGPDGTIVEPVIQQQLLQVLETLAAHLARSQAD